jgi:hypothetical protein
MKYPVNLFNNKFLIAVVVFSGMCTAAIAQETTKPKVDLEHLKYTVEEAPDWTNLFIRTSGWFGADGIYVLPADGARSRGARPSSKNMFIFSDSMIGEIDNGVLGPNKMTHNTVAYFKGDEPKKENINFQWATGADGKPESLFMPNTPSKQKGEYYWLGDGFYNTVLHKTYIFGYRIRTLDPKDDWSFKQFGTNLIILPDGSKAPFKDQQQVETPLFYEGMGNSGTYGVGIFVNTKQAGAPAPDGYVYVYGIKGGGNLVVARVLPKDFENFNEWRFWDGAAWNTDKEKAAILTNGVSNELSLSPLPDGRYILVFQLGGMSSTVAMRIGASPIGPFGSVHKLYEAKVSNSKYYTYNAKAHPSLSKPGELIITYNQNSNDFSNQLKLNPNLYHPYFLRLKFQ